MRSLVFLLSLFHFICASKTPFEVYWNVPSTTCRDVRPENYSIVTNSDRQFNGDKIVIFYSFGALPFCNEKQITGLNTEESECYSPSNGGVPQAANLTLHFEQIQIDINKTIPNVTFDGLAVIDYEAWRPIYDLNHSNRKVYQRYSEQLAAKHCKNCTSKEILELARVAFEAAAKKFFLATLARAKQLRPNAKWAFWAYPLCNGDSGYNHQLNCSSLYHNANKQMKWLFEASDLLLPKIYLYTNDIVPLRRFHVWADIREAFEMKNYHNLRHMPVYAYAKIEYNVLWNNATQTVDDMFYNKVDTCNSIKYPMDMGIDGVIIWSTSYKMADRCDLMRNYVNRILGPATTIVVDQAKKCSINECGGKGRCVAKEQIPLRRCELGYRPPTRCVDF